MQSPVAGMQFFYRAFIACSISARRKKSWPEVLNSLTLLESISYNIMPKERC